VPDVGTQFAGIGEVAPAAQQEPAPAEARRIKLVVLGRPAPAKGEVRGTPKRTGADLAEIFPGLFEQPKAGGMG